MPNPITTVDQATQAGAYDAQHGAGAYYRSPKPIARTTPTVLTDTTFRDKISGINQKADKFVKERQQSSLMETGAAETEEKDPNDLTGYYKSLLDEGNKEIDNDPIQAEELNLLKSLGKKYDSESQAALAGIQGKYEVRRSRLKQAQMSQTSGLHNALMGAGSRYAPGSTGGAMTAMERSQIQDLTDLQTDESALEQDVIAARDNKDFELASKKLEMLDGKRQEKRALSQRIQTMMDEENKKARAAQIQSSRDSAVADLMTQGITNPTEILNYLNYDESGKQTGDFTAKEIADSMKALADTNADGNIDKLSGDLRDFFILKKNGTLTKDIAGLPEDQQLQAWMTKMKPPKTGSGSGSGNKITLTEASNRGLPLSVVGMSENEVAASFGEDDPPEWFAEKANREGIPDNVWNTYRETHVGLTSKPKEIPPEILKDIWDDYRTSYTGKAPVESSHDKSSKANKEKAQSYFKSAYGDDLDDDTIDELSDRVQLYIDGGDSYSEAIKKVIDEAS